MSSESGDPEEIVHKFAANVGIVLRSLQDAVASLTDAFQGITEQMETMDLMMKEIEKRVNDIGAKVLTRH